MTSHEMLHADLLDIIFNNRNKSYGAYALRKEYNNRLFIAVSCGMALSFGLLLLFRGSGSNVVTVPDEPAGPIILKEYELPKEPELPKETKRAQPQPRVAQEHFTNKIAIVPNEQVKLDDVVPPVTDLPDAAIGTEKREGAPATAHTVADVPPAPEATPAAAPATPEVYDVNAVEEPAVFPGGADAFGRYLARQIGTPDGLAPGETKTARVRFIVGKDGTILDIDVLQSAAAPMDAAILRALKRSPRWKPARQHGQPVAVVFTLPVTFVGQEE